MKAHEEAPGAGGTGGGDQEDTGSVSTLPPTGDNSGQPAQAHGRTAPGDPPQERNSREEADTQLLGALLRATTATEVHAMVHAVPAEAFEHRLDQGIWRAGQALADSGIADPARVVQTVVAGGLWPRDLHHEVTVRVIEAIEVARFDSHEWRTPAVDVLTGYARRVTASRLALLATALGSARPCEIGRDLFAVAEFVETIVGWIGHIERPRQVVAA